MINIDFFCGVFERVFNTETTSCIFGECVIFVLVLRRNLFKKPEMDFLRTCFVRYCEKIWFQASYTGR